MLLNIISDLLGQFKSQIDSGSCNMSADQQLELLRYLGTISDHNDIMSKQECCDYLGISRATFDNHVKNGFIPKGFTKGGQQKFWNKSDIDAYLINNCNQQKL